MYGHGSSGPGDGGSIRPGQSSGSGPEAGMNDFYGGVPSHWVGEETSSFPEAPNPYSMGSFVSGALVTPISLADGSFTHARESPVPSHNSQDYQFNLGASAHPQGLGITGFTTHLPQTMTPGLDYAGEGIGYGFPEAAQSHPAPVRRSRRGASRTTPGRATPVTILPHPEGQKRLEEERQGSQLGTQIQQQLPATGRGRRDPQREEEDDFVNRLRDEGYSWKAVAQMFSEKFNKPSTPAQLQMRRARQRERPGRWDENDITLLIRARDQFEREKYRLIAQRMHELGATRTYTAAQCKAQLRRLGRHEQESGSEPRPPDYPRARKRPRTATSRV